MSGEEALLEELEPLIARLATGLVPGNPELRKDLRQEGRIAALLAIRTWDPAVAELSTHAYKRIKGTMQRYLRDKAGPIRRPSRPELGRVPVVVPLTGDIPCDGGIAEVEDRLAAEQLGWHATENGQT